jgi:hypothetical protein
MFRLTIDVPESLKDKAASQASEAGYASMEAYLVDLLRDGIESDALTAPAGQTIRSDSDLEAMIETGIASGDANELTDAAWDRKRQELLDRHPSRVSK